MSDQTLEIIRIVIELLLPAITGALGAIAWLKFFRKKEARLFKNIQRPIAIVATESKPMTHEADLLKRSGLFEDVGEPKSDPRTIDYFKGKRLIIIGYSPSMQNLETIINAARGHEIPVLVYAGPRDITDEHMAILQSYTYHSMCNTPLRLVSDVFAVMSTSPSEDE